MAGKGLANFPGELRSGLISNGTAVLYGHVLIYDATDMNNVSRATADAQASLAGIALVDGAGVGTEISIARSGDVRVRNTSGAPLAANVAIVASAAGGVKLAAGGDKNILGKTNVAIADGEVGSAHIEIVTLP